MTKLSDVRAALLQALAMDVDRKFQANGFARGKNSLVYTRKLPEAIQRISFDIDTLPGLPTGKTAHLRPAYQIAMPAVSKAALELVGNDAQLLAGAPEVVLNQPIEFSAPKDVHRRWLASEAELYSACSEVFEFSKIWLFPLLNSLSTSEDLIKLYEDKDPRIVVQNHFYIFVAAAYQLHGDSEKARELALLRFGSPSLRKRYGTLFVSLGIRT